MKKINNVQETNSEQTSKSDGSKLGVMLIQSASYSLGILVLAGLLKGIVYYKHFGIEITSFLSTSELLVYVLGDIYGILFIVLQAYVYYDFFVMIHNSSKGKEILPKRRKTLLWFSLMGLTTLLFVFFYFAFTDIAMVPVMLMMYIVSISLLTGFLKEEFIGLFSTKKLYVAFCAAGLLSLFALMGAIDIHRVEAGQSPEVALHLKNSKNLRTKNNFKFLGKAGEYYFFYETNTRVAQIIPASEVERVEMR